MNATKKVPASTIHDAARMSAGKYKKVVWRTTSIDVAYCLGARRFLDVYRAIIKDSTSPDGECMLPLIDFSIRINVISAYTNVVMPDTVEDLFDVVYGSDLYDVVVKNANTSQINALINAVWRSVGGDS